MVQLIPRLLLLLISCMLTSQSAAQTYKPLTFENYDPVSTLVVPEHKLSAARFPFIDVHNHQYNMGSGDVSHLINEKNEYESDEQSFGWFANDLARPRTRVCLVIFANLCVYFALLCG